MKAQTHQSGIFVLKFYYYWTIFKILGTSFCPFYLSSILTKIWDIKICVRTSWKGDYWIHSLLLCFLQPCLLTNDMVAWLECIKGWAFVPSSMIGSPPAAVWLWGAWLVLKFKIVRNNMVFVIMLTFSYFAYTVPQWSPTFRWDHHFACYCCVKYLIFKFCHKIHLYSDEAFLHLVVGVSLVVLPLSPHPLLLGGWHRCFHHFGNISHFLWTCIFRIFD